MSSQGLTWDSYFYLQPSLTPGDTNPTEWQHQKLCPALQSPGFIATGSSGKAALANAGGCDASARDLQGWEQSTGLSRAPTPVPLHPNIWQRSCVSHVPRSDSRLKPDSQGEDWNGERKILEARIFNCEHGFSAPALLRHFRSDLPNTRLSVESP